MISEELQNKEIKEKKSLVSLALSLGGLTWSMNIGFSYFFAPLFLTPENASLQNFLDLKSILNIILEAGIIISAILGPFLFTKLTRNSLLIILSLLVILSSFSSLFCGIKGLQICRLFSSIGTSLSPLLCSALSKEYLGDAWHSHSVSMFFIFSGLGFLGIVLGRHMVSSDFLWLFLLVPTFVEGTRVFYFFNYLNFDSPISTFNRLHAQKLQGTDAFAVPEV